MPVLPHHPLPAALALASAIALHCHAGDSGLNVLLVVNQFSSNSCELGNYYAESRQLPPDNILRIPWAGGNTSWSGNDFQSSLLTPITNYLATTGLGSQIHCVVLSMDIPYQTAWGTNLNSTTSALFYGLKGAPGSDPGVTNSYAGSETAFASAPPASATGPSFLATMLTADSLQEARRLVDQGVAGDNTFPVAPGILAKTSDPNRNIRYPYFDNAILNVSVLGASALIRTNTDTFPAWSGCPGYQTGLAQYTLPPGSFLPGSIGDNVTSFGGLLFMPNSQTNLLEFIAAGAAGSYGTVAEPGTDPQKFPDPQVYFYQARGFSLAESYYQSINVPCLGLIVAEPLSAPFRQTATAWCDTPATNTVLSGTATLCFSFQGAPGNHPLQQVDLFIDGHYFSTLTNLAPAPGNTVDILLNGYPVHYTVSTNTTLAAIASDLAGLINTPEITNATRVSAQAHGDRVELQAMTANPFSVPFYIPLPTGTEPVAASLPDTVPPQFSTAGPGADGVAAVQLAVPGSMPYIIEASSNLVDWTILATNTLPGLHRIDDPGSAGCPARFYRLHWPDPAQPPGLSAPAPGANGAFQFHVDSVPGVATAVLASTNLVDWFGLTTNTAGGPFDVSDPSAVVVAAQYYCATQLQPAAPSSSMLSTSAGTRLVRVDGATRPYMVSATNQDGATPLSTNYAVGILQAGALSGAGTAPKATTFATAAQPAFVSSQACGLRQYSVMAGTAAAGAYLQFTVAKTNGQQVIVAVTNLVNGTAASDLAAQFYNLLNTTPALQGPDGIVAQDFLVNFAGVATFNVYARSGGYPAAGIRITPKKSGVYILPSTASTLTQNLSDLQPRNHVYITAGSPKLTVNADLDTTALPDGYHELVAVAYEGSSVRTQTRVTLPVQIQNTPLTATLSLLDVPDPAPVSGSYHVAIDAGTNPVSQITLFTTGGPFATTNASSTAVFQIDGTNLWAGLHPLYAIVQSADGSRYRTAPAWIRLVNSP
ncbi:MAG: TIGR03790 family protein [Verrucomicrobiota bacterium]